MSEMTFYKIRHKVTGLWSAGGYYTSWRKKGGKVWRDRRALSLHLSMIRESENTHKIVEMQHWEIVPFAAVEQTPEPIN